MALFVRTGLFGLPVTGNGLLTGRGAGNETEIESKYFGDAVERLRSRISDAPFEFFDLPKSEAKQLRELLLIQTERMPDFPNGGGQA